MLVCVHVYAECGEKDTQCSFYVGEVVETTPKVSFVYGLIFFCPLSTDLEQFNLSKNKNTKLNNNCMF